MSKDDPFAKVPGPGDPLGPPSRIGPYKILDVLGEGGMGIVYLAEQAAPVHRRVALKIIKIGMDTKHVVARFDSERQALAVMDHPNIAKVYDAGATEIGRPYFVMELVQGTPITEYADTHKLSTEERIRLFQDVCHAIQHAHHKGVIHRDLKPSNILVTVRESRPLVKVIDFGIAKAIGRDLTDRTLVTRVGQMVGTPEYMSPEQAEMSGLDVDTRTDIYSLGVVLFELLVGSLPFDLTSKHDQAIQVTLRERDVPRPSTRLTSLGDTQDAIARRRRTTPSFLRRELKGDLDWIILKAMDKDRTRRYETANAMAADLERYLRREPIMARPPSAAYRLNRFVERNRAAVIAGCIALVAVLGGAGAATMGMLQARHAQVTAEEEAETARRVADFLVDLFQVSDPGEARGNTITAREILDRGAERIDAELADQPRVQARLMRTMGDVYRELGLYDAARPLLRRAAALAESSGAAPAELAETLQRLGILLRQQGAYDEAEPVLERALGLARDTEEPDEATVLRYLRSLADLYVETGRFDQAEPLLKDVLARQEASPETDEATLALTLNNLGGLYLRQQRFADAEGPLERAMAIRQRLLGPDHPDLAQAYNNLGALYWYQGKFPEAEQAYEKARDIWTATLEPDHPRIAAIENNLGETYWAEGRYEEAEAAFEKALDIKQRAYGADNPSVAITLNGLANVYRDAGRPQDAESLYRRALTIRQSNGDSVQIAETRRDLARLLRTLGRDDEAQAMEGAAGG